MDKQHITAITLEKRCIDMFAASNWDLNFNTKTKLPNGSYFRPDITLSYNNKIMGCVEVKTTYSNDTRSNIKFIEQVRFIITEFKPTVFIFTNGYIFDLYLEGEYFAQLSFVPSPEDIEILLKYRKENN